MDHIYFYDSATMELLSKKTKSLHSSTPAMFSGDMSIPAGFDQDFWDKYLKQLCARIRKKWQGIETLSVCFSISPDDSKIYIVAGLSSGVYSLSLFVLDYFVNHIMKLKSNSPQDIDISCSEDEEESEEVSPDLVQIHASPQEVEQWIQSFINGKRNLINIQNIKDFCVPEGQKQNCARVDAVLVKRKNTSGHIGVEHVSNYWGPQLYKKMAHGSKLPLLASHPPANKSEIKTEILDPTESQSQQSQSSGSCDNPPPAKKIALTAADINKRLENLKTKIKNARSDSDSS